MKHIISAAEHASTCEVCRMRELLEREAKAEGKGEAIQSLILPCDHDGTARFLWYGRIPKTEREADKLCSALKKAFEISKKRGRKPSKFTLDDVLRVMKELAPDAGISHLADALGVTSRQIPPALKQLFLEGQAARQSGAKSRLRYPRRRHRRRI